MGPKPRPRPERWSLDKAKRDQATVTTFDQESPTLPQPKERGEHGKFVPSKGKK